MFGTMGSPFGRRPVQIEGSCRTEVHHFRILKMNEQWRLRRWQLQISIGACDVEGRIGEVQSHTTDATKTRHATFWRRVFAENFLASSDKARPG